MTTTPLHQRTDALLRRLVHRGDAAALRKVLSRSRVEDVAAALEHLTGFEQRRLYRAVEDRDKAAEILAHLSDDAVRAITSELTEEYVADLVERLEPDDGADLVAALPDDLRERVLAEMEPGDQHELAQLLEYEPDSAGGLMSTDFFAMTRADTCGRAVRELQKSSDERANVHYVYVLDDERRLCGVVSLRGLVVHPPNTPLVSVMTPDPIAVRAGDDQEEVARYAARYDLLAVPVVDERGRMLGIVTVDDVLDVVGEEIAEDMYRMVGLSQAEDPVAAASTFEQSRRRAGWLLATIAGGIVASEIIGAYQAMLAQVAVLAGFIPVVMGMGGNVGMQAATLAVRGLATGQVQLGGALSFVWRQSRVGLVLGVTFGLLLGAYGFFRFPEQPLVGASIGLSVATSMSLASLLGGGVPVLLARAGVDPAIATGPMVTMMVDLLGIVVYVNIARTLLGL